MTVLAHNAVVLEANVNLADLYYSGDEDFLSWLDFVLDRVQQTQERARDQAERRR